MDFGNVHVLDLEEPASHQNVHYLEYTAKYSILNNLSVIEMVTLPLKLPPWTSNMMVPSALSFLSIRMVLTSIDPIPGLMSR